MAGVVYPSGFALGLRTQLPPPATAAAAVSAVTVFTTSTRRPVALSSFPLAGAGPGRRAAAVGCAAGFEWRYARGGSVVCGCPANALCAGETTCGVVPQAQEQWQVILVPVAACTPTNADASTNASASVGVNSLPNTPAESPPMGLILGLILGLGLPVLLGAGAASAYAVSRGKRPAGAAGAPNESKVLPELEEPPLLSSSLAFPSPAAGEAALHVVGDDSFMDRPTNAGSIREQPLPSPPSYGMKPEPLPQTPGAAGIPEQQDVELSAPVSGSLLGDLVVYVEGTLRNVTEAADACSQHKTPA